MYFSLAEYNEAVGTILNPVYDHIGEPEYTLPLVPVQLSVFQNEYCGRLYEVDQGAEGQYVGWEGEEQGEGGDGQVEEGEVGG